MRSSGNPLSKEMWCKMISSDDVVYVKNNVNKLVSIDSFVGFADGKAVITTTTVDLIFGGYLSHGFFVTMTINGRLYFFNVLPDNLSPRRNKKK